LTSTQIKYIFITMNKKPIEREFLTLKEAADIIGVHYETIRRWHLKEGLKSYRFKNTLRFKKEDLIKFLEHNNK